MFREKGRADYEIFYQIYAFPLFSWRRNLFLKKAKFGVDKQRRLCYNNRAFVLGRILAE